MRALIRDDEIWLNPQISESELIWQSTKFPNGNSYALCEDCPEDAVAADFDVSERTVVIGDEEDKKTVIRMLATLNRQRYDQRKAQETDG